ncbi:ABC transporter ATP-binding protein, partial [Bacillus thuringiensis]|nr:ABC transporter ATP-binding protein [Bacillus thuringiensis]
IRELREFIHKHVKEENMSVFITSHLLSEVQMISDRVAIIHKGKMITAAKVEEIIITASERAEWIVTTISKAKDILEAAKEVREVSV